MTQPRGTLTVQVVGDVRDFGKQVEAAINKAMRSVRIDGRPIENQLGKIGDAGTEAFRELGNDARAALNDVARIADKAGDDIGRGLAAGGERAEDALKEVGDQGERQMDRIEREAKDAGSGMLRNLSLAAVGIGAAFAAIQVGQFFLAAAQAAEDLGSAMENSQQIIKATGAAAGLTAQQVREISRSLSLKIGVDSVEVQNAANVLLTFKAVTGDTFTRAIGLAGDLSAVLGTDLQGATLQLGKALQNPVKGISALTRAGVDFTDSQKEQIKGYIETNQLAKAQGLILAEVASQVGGVAAAGVDSTDQLKNAFTDLKREAGESLIGFIDNNAPQMISILQTLEPVLSSVGGAMATAFEAVLPIIDLLANALGDAFTSVGPLIQPIVDIFASLLSVMPGLLPIFAELVGSLLPPLANVVGVVVEALGPIIPLIAGLAVQLITALAPILPPIGAALAAVAAVIGGALQQVLPPLAAILLKVIEALLPLVPAALGLLVALLPLARPILDVVMAVLPLVAALTPLISLLITLINVPLKLISPLISLLAIVLKPLTPLIELLAEGLAFVLKPLELLTPLIEKFTTWLDGLDWGAIGKAIGGAFKDAWDAVVNFFKGVQQWFANLGRWFAALPGKLWAAVKSLPGKFKAGLAVLPRILGEVFKRAMSAALKAIGIGIGLVLAAVIGLPVLIVRGLSALGELLVDLIKKAWHAVQDATVAGVTVVVEYVKGAPERFMKGLAVLKERISNFFSGLWKTAKEKTVAGVDAMVTFVKDLPRKVVAALGALGAKIGEIFRQVWGKAKDLVRDGINGVIDLVKNAPKRLGELKDRFIETGKRLIKGFMDGFGKAGAFIKDVAGNIVASIKGFLNKIIRKLNAGIASVDDKLPFVELPRIPELARGGLTTQGGLAALHPSELVLPLEDRRAVDLLAKAMQEANAGLRAAGVPGAEGMALEPHFTVVVEIDGQQLEARIVRVVDKRDRTVRQRVRAGAGRSR